MPFFIESKDCFLVTVVWKVISQVELAHGGRAQSYSYDRPSSFSNGRRGGVSRRSELRGLYFCRVKELSNMSGLEFSFFFSCCEPHSYGWWFTFVSVMARSQGTGIVHEFCLYIFEFDVHCVWLAMSVLLYLLTLLNFTYSGPYATGWRCLFFWCIPRGRRLVTMLPIISTL